VQSVQVIHKKMMGTPQVLHQGVESNVSAFILSPIISNITPNPGAGATSASIGLTVNPSVKDTQRVILLLNEYNIGPVTVQSLSYSFQAPVMPHTEPPSTTNTLTIPISGVKTGVYLVRIQVDGAESPLGSDASGKYDSPQVSIP